MFKFVKKTDLLLALIIGEAFAWLALPILKNINLTLPFINARNLIIGLPILSVIGLYFAAFVGKFIPVLYQFAKYFLVGSLNTAVDFGVLNLLIFISGISTGIYFSLFKGISFIVAVTNSYLWNRFWVFNKSPQAKLGGPENYPKTGVNSTAKQFSEFLLISIGGFILNVGAASFLVNFVGPHFGLNLVQWANFAAAIAAFVSLIWNFSGYKFFVFKK